jgi:hypothetical protein
VLKDGQAGGTGNVKKAAPRPLPTTPAAAASASAPSTPSTGAAPPLPARNAGWREQYNDKGSSGGVVDDCVELTKEIFSKSQAIVRYGTEETVAANLADLNAQTATLLEKVKSQRTEAGLRADAPFLIYFPFRFLLSFASIKAKGLEKPSAETTSHLKTVKKLHDQLLKAKPNLQKLEPNVSKLRDTIRALNKIFKTMAGGQ